MPSPSKDAMSELVGEFVRRRGFDLEDVVVTSAGQFSTVRVIVDRDEGTGLDDLGDLSRSLSDELDAADLGSAPYTLEVTTPGIDHPLTQERHWRRARGRKVRIETQTERVDGRIGALTDAAVDIVVRDKRGLRVRPVRLNEIRTAQVQVEFSAPSREELDLAGGVAPGRPAVGGPIEGSGGSEEEGDDK